MSDDLSAYEAFFPPRRRRRSGETALNYYAHCADHNEAHIAKLMEVFRQAHQELMAVDPTIAEIHRARWTRSVIAVLEISVDAMLEACESGSPSIAPVVDFGRLTRARKNLNESISRVR